MISRFTINILVFLCVQTCYSQVQWQYVEIPTNGEYETNSLVSIESRTFVAYTSYFGSSTEVKFFVLDSLGLKVNDTSFSTSSFIDENFYRLFNLNNSKVAMVSCLFDSANNYGFNVVTCFDSLGNFLWRVENDSAQFGAIGTESSNDSIFIFYIKGANCFIDIYNSSGVLVNHLVSSRYSITGNLLEFQNFRYRNGVFYIFGDEVLNGNDTQMFIRGIDLSGNIVFDGTYNPTTGYDRVTNVDVDDNFNVAYGGFADSSGIYKFQIGSFNSSGSLIWQKSELYGLYYTYPVNLFIKNSTIFATTNTGIPGGGLYSIDKYSLFTGIKSNLFFMDSLYGSEGFHTAILSNDKLLVGGLRGIFPSLYCHFLEVNLSTSSVDTIFQSQPLLLSFPYMIPRDSSGFYYGRGSIVYYFEKTITSISENEISNDSQLPYPNPFYDKLNLECKETDIINFYDYSGRLCLTSIKSDLPNKIHQLHKGNYIVEIVGGSISRKFRLVKN
jgi:hypothetical protein